MKINLMKKVVSAGLAITMLGALAGCSDSKNNSQSSSPSSTSSSSEKSSGSSLVTTGVVENQLAMPAENEQIAVFNIAGYGTFKCRLFPEAAPKAVENFVKLAQAGKYTNVPFHRVIEDFMIQSGDTTKNGGDGKSIYGNGFAVEFNSSLHHYNGALAVARSNSHSNGQSSQFYVVSSEKAKTMSDSDFQAIEQSVNSTYQKLDWDISLKYSDSVKQNYKQVGGYPGLDMQYTVFGQAFEGMDVVNAISKCPKSQTAGDDGAKSVPEPGITISSIEITNYNG